MIKEEGHLPSHLRICLDLFLVESFDSRSRVEKKVGLIFYTHFSNSAFRQHIFPVLGGSISKSTRFFRCPILVVGSVLMQS